MLFCVALLWRKQEQEQGPCLNSRAHAAHYRMCTVCPALRTSPACVEKYKSIKKIRFNIIIYKILSLNLYLLFFGLLRYFTVLTKLLSNVTHRGTDMLAIN